MLEMGVPGSEYCDCEDTGKVGAVLRRKKDGSATIIGQFFRVENYLVTAYHVASVMWDAEPSDIEFAAYVKRDGCLKVDPGSVNPKRIGIAGIDKYAARDLSSYAEKRKKLLSKFLWGNEERIGEDIYMCWLSDDFWSKLGMAKLSVTTCRTRSFIKTLGPDLQHGHLMTASGAVESVDRGNVNHMASTERGWSGSPILTRGGVIAVHCGTNKDTNYGVLSILMAPYLDKFISKTSKRVVEEDSSSFTWNNETGEFSYQGKTGAIYSYRTGGGADWDDIGCFLQTEQGESHFLGHGDEMFDNFKLIYGESEANDLMQEVASGSLSSKRARELIGKGTKTKTIRYENGAVCISPVLAADSDSEESKDVSSLSIGSLVV